MSKIYDFFGAVGKLGLQQLSRRSLPKTKGKSKIKGIKKDIEIIRDEWGIPHIYAQNIHDLAFAQGYVQAQDRLWQMELNKRVATGTLAEIFGVAALEIDIASRTLGFPRIGKQDQALMPKSLIKIMKSFLKGINASRKQQLNNLPVEFVLAGFSPQKWTISDLMTFSRLMAWQLSHGWQGSLIRAKLIDKVGALAANELEMHYDPDNPAILENGIEVNVAKNEVLKGLESSLLQQGNGSNSWVIDGRFTDTGKPLLANDPHLFLNAPAIWYENHLHCPELHVTGVTIPGLPLVAIGHNDQISWGVTLAFSDCEDVFLEEFHPEDNSQYLFREEWKKATIIEEEFTVKGLEEVEKRAITLTHHGPIISDMLKEPNKKIALASKALSPAPLLRAWWMLNNAKCWKEFVHAMSFMAAPQMSIVYADVKGNIGFWMTGKVPIRAKGDGRLPVPGWSGEFEWVGEVPFTHMPHIFNPEKGYIITANHKGVADDYPYNLGYAWMNGYRAKRLDDLFQQKKQIDMLACKQMQVDLFSIPGQQLVDIYRAEHNKFKVKDWRFHAALHRFLAWDGELTKDTVGGCIYKITCTYLVKVLLEKSLGEELTLEIMGKGLMPLVNRTTEFQGHDIYTIIRMLNNPESWWLDKVGGKALLLEKAFQKAVNYLTENIDPDMKKWKWGTLHRAIFSHAMSAKSSLAPIFNVGPVPMGGDGDTPWQANDIGSLTFPNTSIVSASYRLVVDLDQFGQSQAVLPPGNSGHIASEHYKDQIDLWINAQFRPMLWTRKQVEVYAEEKLVLTKK